MKIKDITYSSTGALMKGNKNIRTWEELLKITGYKKLDTLKNKLKGKIDLLVLKHKTRTETLLIASQEQAGNKKKSDYQIKTFENKEQVVKTRNQKNLEYKSNDIFFKNIKELNETLVYLSDGTITTFDYMLIDLETGEILLDEESFRIILLRSGIEGIINFIFPNKNNINNTAQTKLIKQMILNNKRKNNYEYDIIQEIDLLELELTDNNIFKCAKNINLSSEQIKKIKNELIKINNKWSTKMNKTFDIASNLTHYNDAYFEKSFYITENDISNLDIFFMHDVGTNKAKIIREPFFNFSVASYTKTKPIYQLGSNHIVTFNSGIGLIAGRIIINAFHNIPLVNTLIATKTISAKIEDIPPIDLYIVNKHSQTYNRAFQDLVIKNIKFTSFNFEQGLEPGRFFVLEYLATDMQGIQLKDYIKEQIYINNQDEIDISDKIYSNKLNEYNEFLAEQEKIDTENNLNQKFNLFLSLCNSHCYYFIPLTDNWDSTNVTSISPKNKSETDKIKNAKLDQTLLKQFKDLNEINEIHQSILNEEYKAQIIYDEDLKGFNSPIIEKLNADQIWKDVYPQFQELKSKCKQITEQYCYYSNIEIPNLKPEVGIEPGFEDQEINDNYYTSEYKETSELSISNNGIQLIKEFENFSEYAYRDAGKWSIGYGSQLYIDGSPVKQFDRVSKAKAEEMLKYDLKNRREKDIKSRINVKLSQPKFDALCSLVYNIGSLSVATKMVGHINKKNFNKAALEFDDIIKSEGKVLDVLIKRRAKEKRLFLSI